jgi:hypothetical protein
MPASSRRNPLFDALKSSRHKYDPIEIIQLFTKVSEERVKVLAANLSRYIVTNLPAAFSNRNGLTDYRTNPYVLLTSAQVIKLNDPTHFATFLFNSKLYMGLETSFGKSVEKAFIGSYPIVGENKWIDPPEKEKEFTELIGLSRQDRARRRTKSVWREIDKSCISGTTRYLLSIKSGPNTINDSQVQAMTDAISQNYESWARETKRNHPSVSQLDIVIGLTYGTDKTTNNKENQILCKMLEHGFKEEDPKRCPGVLRHKSKPVRLYRCIGKEFWAFIGNPAGPSAADHIFLEVLLALSRALSVGLEITDIEDRINNKISALANALANLRFPRGSLPGWVRDEFSEDELFWFATALTAFYDEGI